MNTQTIMTLIDQYGYLAIIFLIMLENVFPPIPSEVILTFTGFLTLTSHLTVWGAILASTLAQYWVQFSYMVLADWFQWSG